MASSRVGQMMRAPGARPVGSEPSAVPATIRSMAGIPKASVLPVPVFAWPMRSWPAIARGSACSWIGNAVTIPWSDSARTICGWMPSSANVGRRWGDSPSLGMRP